MVVRAPPARARSGRSTDASHGMNRVEPSAGSAARILRTWRRAWRAFADGTASGIVDGAATSSFTWGDNTMSRLIYFTAAALIAVSGAVRADTPTLLSEAEMEGIVAGDHAFWVVTPGTVRFMVDNGNGRDAVDLHNPNLIVNERSTPAGQMCISIANSICFVP